MGRVTDSKLKTKTVASKVNGFLEPQDLYAAIRSLVPKAPPSAKISIWVDVPSGGDYSGAPLMVDNENTIKFTVTWEEEDK